MEENCQWQRHNRPRHLVPILYSINTFVIFCNYFQLTGELLTPMSASQSSTYDTTGELYGAANCIDGNVAGTSCHTANDRHPWLALDYGKTFAIQTVQIFNRHDCCGARTRNVEVRVSEELPAPATTTDNQKFSGGSLLGTFPGPGTDGHYIIIRGEDL